MTNDRIQALLKQRILILDGAMGTMIQRCKLQEEDFRGQRFRDWPFPLKGNNDLLCLTRPDIVSRIHEEYLEAGADIIETNSFNANAVSMRDYGMESLVFELNREAARLARRACDVFTARNPLKPRLVAGSMGPTTKMASLSPLAEDPACRSTDFDVLEAAYHVQVGGLVEGGADILLIETVIDTLNAKAALMAVSRYEAEKGISVPVMLSVSVHDAGGRILSGQTMEAFLVSVSGYRLLSVGLNCALGAAQMKNHLELLAAQTRLPVSAHPNAGMPDQFGRYTQTPEEMAEIAGTFLEHSLVNILGGCCGTTPAHIRKLAVLAEGYSRSGHIRGRNRSGGQSSPGASSGGRTRDFLTPGIPSPSGLSFSGLEPLYLKKTGGLIRIGERTNVAGSRQFARLIRENRFEEALGIAAGQAGAGSHMLDVCMDDPMLDASQAMRKFLNLVVSDPYTARLPLVIDSSDWNVIETALKSVPGRSLVNSISLKAGEKTFLKRARQIRRLGGIPITMLFDEAGQADSLERKTAVAARVYRLLTRELGYAPEDIVLDPNVLAIGTGVAAHNGYALDFIHACRWIRENLAGAHTCGGISNLSFAFRGHEVIRSAMHGIFLAHAQAAGLDLAIVNPKQLQSPDTIPAPLRELAEDIVLNRRPDATDRMLAYAAETGKREAGEAAGGRQAGEAAGGRQAGEAAGSRRNGRTVNDLQQPAQPESVRVRLEQAIVTGRDHDLPADLKEALNQGFPAMKLLEGPLMQGMHRVGELFGQGKMFLPEVVRSARAMKKAVECLQPYLDGKRGTDGERGTDGRPDKDGTLNPGVKRGKVVLATVKGDVHDIGKHIVSLVLACNGYEVIDLGVMVPREKIVEAAIRQKADIVGLSGLISPSLREMVDVAGSMQEAGLEIPLLIGGAPTSEIHTAVRIAPAYPGRVIHVRDAAAAAGTAVRLTGEHGGALLGEIHDRYQTVAGSYRETRRAKTWLPLNEAREKGRAAMRQGHSPTPPANPGIHSLNGYPLEKLAPDMDWSGFLHAWNIRGNYPEILRHPEKGPEAARLLRDAQNLLRDMIANKTLEARGVFGLFRAAAEAEDLVFFDPVDQIREAARFHFLRNQETWHGQTAGGLCLSDFVAPADSGIIDYAGCFVVSVHGAEQLAESFSRSGNDYLAIMTRLLADRLAEAFAEHLHRKVGLQYWGYVQDGTGNPCEIAESLHKGIRPAPGYPACPDHSEKRTIFSLLGAERQTGCSLTENFAMQPVSSVCGWYLAHPKARYFEVGKIHMDQLTAYAEKKRFSLARAKQLLHPNLGESVAMDEKPDSTGV